MILKSESKSGIHLESLKTKESWLMTFPYIETVHSFKKSLRRALNFREEKKLTRATTNLCELVSLNFTSCPLHIIILLRGCASSAE